MPRSVSKQSEPEREVVRVRGETLVVIWSLNGWRNDDQRPLPVCQLTATTRTEGESVSWAWRNPF
jgi:hypothetical protein